MEFLKPLTESSHQATELEQALTEIFVQLYAEHLADRDHSIDCSGVPWLADFETQARFSAQDGISIYYKAGYEAHMTHIFRAWSSRRVKRGLNFLDFYMRMLWPEQYSIDWLWHNRDLAQLPYPTALTLAETPNHFPTHRFVLSLDQSISLPDIQQILPSLRSVVPAEYVMQGVVRRMDLGNQPLGLAHAAVATACMTFTCGDPL
ncbi:MAG: hypothetical protein VXW65_14140 [Pseudomonadota bacterium]|nr:hypothetical protein [Pseudomonadota bacterium]